MSNTRDADREVADATGRGSRASGSLVANAREFLGWWGDELAGLAPAGLRKAFGASPEIATVQEVDGKIVLKRKQGGSGRVLVPGTRSPGLPKGGAVYLLPEDGALRRERRLPGASRAHIHEIMNLQMASETPFTVDEVYSDSIITAELHDSNEILVSQALAPRGAIDAIADQMRRDHGIELAAIDLAGNGPDGRAGFNLLAPSKRPRASSGLFTPGRILLLGLVAGAVFAGLSWRDLQQRRIDAADALLGDAEGGAAGTMEVSTRVSQGIGGIQRLAAEQRDPVSFLRVYNEVARVLPDGSWLEEFTYERPVAYVTGLSANSATLVQAFESSEMVASARFASPVVTDPVTGAERFRLEVTFKTPGETPATPAPQSAEEPQQ